MDAQQQKPLVRTKSPPPQQKRLFAETALGDELCLLFSARIKKATHGSGGVDDARFNPRMAR